MLISIRNPRQELHSAKTKTITIPPSPYPDATEKANLTDLMKYTEYHITVLCFTHPGDGNISAPIIVTTKEDGKIFCGFLV